MVQYVDHQGQTFKMWLNQTEITAVSPWRNILRLGRYIIRQRWWPHYDLAWYSVKVLWSCKSWVSFLCIRLQPKKPDLWTGCVTCGKFQVFLVEKQRCVFTPTSPETLSRSSGGSVDFDKSHSQDETQLPNFSSNIPPWPINFPRRSEFAQHWLGLSSPGSWLNSYNGHTANCAEPQNKPFKPVTQHYSHLSSTKSFFSVICGTFKWHVFCSRKAVNFPSTFLCLYSWIHSGLAGARVKPILSVEFSVSQ